MHMRDFDFDKAHILIDMYGSKVAYASYGSKEQWGDTSWFLYAQDKGYLRINRTSFLDTQTPILHIKFTDGTTQDYECYKVNEENIAAKQLQKTIQSFCKTLNSIDVNDVIDQYLNSFK